MQIRVKNVKAGKEIQLDVEVEEDTVAVVKAKVEAQEGIPVAQQRIIFRGKTLDDGQTLGELGLQNGAKMHLVLTAARPKPRWYAPSPHEVRMRAPRPVPGFDPGHRWWFSGSAPAAFVGPAPVSPDLWKMPEIQYPRANEWVSFCVGDQVKYFSSSKKNWMDTEIIVANEVDGVQVALKPGYTITPDEYRSKLKRKKKEKADAGRDLLVEAISDRRFIL